MGAMILFVFPFSLITAEDSYLLEASISSLLEQICKVFALMDDFEP